VTRGRLWSIVERLARGLDPLEREAVLGDLYESGSHGIGAIADVAGIIARRRLAPWRAIAPWAALVVLIPAGWGLGRITLYYARTTGIYAWLYCEHWTWGHLASGGARAELATHVIEFVGQSILLAAGGWLGGTVAGKTHRHAAAPLLMLFLVTSVLAMGYAFPLGLAYGPNSAAFAQASYRVGLPAVFECWLAASAIVAWALPYRHFKKGSSA
jgi:hypothetical protein